MRATTIKSLLTLWDSQGLFQGDGNRVQQYCKSWCISNESEQKVDLLKVQTLAQNPDVYKALFDSPLAENQPDEWRTLAPEESDELLEEIQRWQSQRESG